MNKKLTILLTVFALIILTCIGAYAFLVSPTKGPSQPPAGQPPMGGNRPPMQPLAEASAPQADMVATSTGQMLYMIDAASSTATFTLDEMLRGEPKTVVGTSTGYIAGEIGFDQKNPASSTIGVIKLNARTFVTDDKMRNNALRRMILKTEDDANEFITFKPGSINGPDTDVPGVYDVTGDLTISGVTKATTFRINTEIDAVDKTTLRVHAKTTIKRSDFSLVIPDLSFLANVTDEVKLDLELVAIPVNQ